MPLQEKQAIANNTKMLHIREIFDTLVTCTYYGLDTKDLLLKNPEILVIAERLVEQLRLKGSLGTQAADEWRKKNASAE